jgi:hypothetical protein
MSTVLGKLRKALPLLGILIALALPLMFILEDFVRDAIVTPLAYLAWLSGVILDALPQALFLSTIVIIGIYVAAKSLHRERTDVREAQPRSYRSEGAVALWNERLGRAAEGAYSRERLNYFVGQLLTRTIAHEEHLSPREILHAVDRQEVALPAELRAFLDLAYRGGYPTKPPWYRRLAAFLMRSLSLRTADNTAPRELEAGIAPILDYIEAQLRMEPTEVTSEQQP